MASDLSTYLGNKVVRWIGGQAMPTAPASVALALFNGNPKAGGVEVTEDVRVAGRLNVSWTVPASGTDNELTNDAEADFGNSASDVTITHAALYDGSNLLASKALPGQPFEVTTGSQVKFNVGSITFTVGSAV